MSNLILQVDSSARQSGSISREITRYASERLSSVSGNKIIPRDLSKSTLPFVTEPLIGAYFTPPEERSNEQKALLELSDGYINELKSANTLVIGAPIYNFSIPAALKAWIDLICRVGETFVYGEAGPKGLLEIDTAYIVTSAGGTEIGSDIDFNSQYLQQVCQFIGVKKSIVIDVSGSKRDPEMLIDYGKQQVGKLI